jgi:hypothetical protein
VDRLLPARLGALLALENDVVFAERLRRVDEAAARAISKLGDLDLVKYESDAPLDDSADLSLWEVVAPVVGSTIADVNVLLAEIDAQFPEGQPEFDHRHQHVAELIVAGKAELRIGVMEFGMRARDPSVVSDRWNLIAELQTFRLRFRERIGVLVFETALKLGDCRRSDVDPGYDESLASWLVVRSTTADLRRLMRARIHKVSEAAPEDVEWHGQQIEKELNAFGRTAAWRALPAIDKKRILEFRAQLKSQLNPQLTKFELLALLEPFVEFIDGFASLAQNEGLSQHDMELQASMGVVLEQAMTATSPENQLAAFTEAVGTAQALYGRSPEFDSFLRKLRKTPPTRETMTQELEQCLQLLANLVTF